MRFRIGSLCRSLPVTLAMMTAPAGHAQDGWVAGGDTYLTITLVAPEETGATAAGDPWMIFLDGHLDPHSASRLSAVVTEHRIESASVYLNSPGGSLVQGMAIGRLLRDLGFETNVGRRAADPRRPTAGVCYSACPFAYAGGARRALLEGSVLGVHRVTNRVPVPDDAAFERRVRGEAVTYLAEMGVSQRLVELAMQAPAGEIRLISRSDALALRLVNVNGAATSPASTLTGRGVPSMDSSGVSFPAARTAWDDSSPL